VASDITGAAGDKHGHELIHLPIAGGCYPGRDEEWVSAQANWSLCLMLRIGKVRNRSVMCRSRTIPLTICS
jgi:hypothetical protein